MDNLYVVLCGNNFNKSHHLQIDEKIFIYCLLLLIVIIYLLFRVIKSKRIFVMHFRIWTDMTNGYRMYNLFQFVESNNAQKVKVQNTNTSHNTLYGSRYSKKYFYLRYRLPWAQKKKYRPVKKRKL